MDAHQWWKDEKKNTKIPTFGSGRVIEMFVWEKQALMLCVGLKTLGAAELHHCPVPQFALGFPSVSLGFLGFGVLGEQGRCWEAGGQQAVGLGE